VEEKLDGVQEVKPIREVPRQPEHCGKRMRKLSGIGTASGKLVTVYACECGHQERHEQREPVK
jgi:hypothetical protein